MGYDGLAGKTVIEWVFQARSKGKVRLGVTWTLACLWCDQYLDGVFIEKSALSSDGGRLLLLLARQWLEAESMCIPIRGFVISTFLALLTTESIAQGVSYPLDIGSRWGWALYLNTSSYPVEIERDTLLPNGHRYAIVPSYWSMPERWERTEGMRVYRYERGTGREWLLFDFSKSPGDTINRSPFVVMLAARMDTLFGATRRTWEFSVGGTPGGIDAGAGAGYIITDLSLIHI